MHDNEELSALIQSDLVARVTLHEWPLSCVQRLAASDGRTFIYKVQFGPTVEPEFYARASSELLVSGETIYGSGDHAAMLLEFVDGPLLESLALPEEEVVRIGRAVMEQIAQIEGELPCFIDISTEEKWGQLIDLTLKTIGQLVVEGKFKRVGDEAVHRLERWALSGPVLAAIDADPRYVHGDLRGDNLFALPTGYRLIDWQRPLWGPAGLDLASLLESLGIDPLGYVAGEVVRIMYLLRIHWFARCAQQWFPAGTETYDRSIAQLVLQIGKPP